MKLLLKKIYSGEKGIFIIVLQGSKTINLQFSLKKQILNQAFVNMLYKYQKKE